MKNILQSGLIIGTLFVSITTLAEAQQKVVARDAVAPSTPKGVVVSPNHVTKDRFTVTWNASTDNVGVTGYRVYRNIARTRSVFVATTTGTSFTDNTAFRSMTSYSIVAFDAAGNSSAKSEETLSKDIYEIYMNDRTFMSVIHSQITTADAAVNCKTYESYYKGKFMKCLLNKEVVYATPKR